MGRRLQLVKAGQPPGSVASQVPVSSNSTQLAVAGKGSSPMREESPSTPASSPITARRSSHLHRQRHARLQVVKKRIGMGHYDAGAPACLFVPSHGRGDRNGSPAGTRAAPAAAAAGQNRETPRPWLRLWTSRRLSGGGLSSAPWPAGQLAHQEEVAVLVTGIDGAIAGAVGQHFGQLGQMGEPLLRLVVAASWPLQEAQ